MAVPTLGEFVADSIVHAIGLWSAPRLRLSLLSQWQSTAKRKTDRYHHLYGRVDRNAWLLCGLHCPLIEPPIFERLDQSAIFLMIAGTYTPFTTLCLKGVWVLG